MTISQELLLRAYPPTPPQVNARIDETLATLHRQTAARPPRRYALRLRFVAALVSLLVLLAAIGVAAGIHFGVFDFMRRLLSEEGMLPEAVELVQTGLAVMETPHTSIALSQVVYDGGNLRLVYGVRLKGAVEPISSTELSDEASDFHKALAADGVSPFGCDWFFVDGTEYAMTGGSTGATVPGAENGEALYYMDISFAPYGIVPQGDFKVSLPIVRHGVGDYETLDFTVKSAMAGAAPATKQVTGATVTVLSAFLSPVRGTVHLRVDLDEGISPLQAELILADWHDALLVDRDGNEIAQRLEFQVLAEGDGKSAEYSYTFAPTDTAEAYFAPTVVDEKDNWYPDMSQAIQVK